MFAAFAVDAQRHHGSLILAEVDAIEHQRTSSDRNEILPAQLLEVLAAILLRSIGLFGICEFGLLTSISRALELEANALMICACNCSGSLATRHDSWRVLLHRWCYRWNPGGLVARQLPRVRSHQSTA